MSGLNNKRYKEFIWYHINGDGDCNGQVLREYAKGLNEQDCFDLAYFYATTYCCASAVFLLDNRDMIKADCHGFANEYKHKLIFQSDRKYVRMLDNFYKMLLAWKNRLSTASAGFRDRVVARGVLNAKEALSIVEGWFFFSRFSAYLFVETYCDIMGLSATRERGLKYEGDSMTFVGGLFYVYGMDAEARYVHKYHKLPIDVPTLEYLIVDLQNGIRVAGGDDNFTKVETSLCAYEKFFRGTRYNGYYADRQLGELEKMRCPEFDRACGEVYRARARAIKDVYRGEVNGWRGVRAELKKSYEKTQKILGCPV